MTDHGDPPVRSPTDDASRTSDRVRYPIYTTEGLCGALRQGELITGLIRYEFVIESQTVQLVRIPMALVVSQDCDLDWDYKLRNGDPKAQENKRLEHVLLYTVVEAGVARSAKDMNSKIWPRLRDNKDERYQFLETVPTMQDSLGQGLPEMVIDFKRYFTIRTEEVYRQLGDDSAERPRRRCRLIGPFREHLQNRACFYQARIGLPLDHMSEPTIA